MLLETSVQIYLSSSALLSWLNIFVFTLKSPPTITVDEPPPIVILFVDTSVNISLSSSIPAIIFPLTSRVPPINVLLWSPPILIVLVVKSVNMFLFSSISEYKCLPRCISPCLFTRNILPSTCSEPRANLVSPLTLAL